MSSGPAELAPSSADSAPSRRPGPLGTAVAWVVLVVGLLLVPVALLDSAFNVAPTTGSTFVEFPVVELAADDAADPATDDANWRPGRTIDVESWPDAAVHDAVYAPAYLSYVFVGAAGVVIAIVAGAVLRGRPFSRIVVVAFAALAALGIVLGIAAPRLRDWGVRHVVEAQDLPTSAEAARAAGYDFYFMLPDSQGAPALLLAGIAAGLLALYVGFSRTCSPDRARS